MSWTDSKKECILVSPSDTSNDAIVQRLAPNSMMTNASTKTHSTNQACKEMMKRKKSWADVQWMQWSNTYQNEWRKDNLLQILQIARILDFDQSLRQPQRWHIHFCCRQITGSTVSMFEVEEVELYPNYLIFVVIPINILLWLWGLWQLGTGRRPINMIGKVRSVLKICMTKVKEGRVTTKQICHQFRGLPSNWNPWGCEPRVISGEANFRGQVSLPSRQYSVLLLQVPAWWADPSKANNDGMM